MKAKYLFTAFLASVALLSSCEKELDHYLDEIQVSSSYVAINVDGGSTTIDLTTVGDWKIENAPSWLTISPTSGNAAVDQKVSFSANSTLDGRKAEVYITCAGRTQIINVIQGLSVVSPATVKEVMEGPNSKTFLVTGVVTAITETAVYGNFYMNDGTSATDLYIYGTLYNGASKQAALLKYGIEVGDEVTVSGPKSTYGTTVELVDVEVIKVNKSLIGIDSVDPEEPIAYKGGETSVTLKNKGQGIYVEIPETASWLSIKAIAGNVVTFAATENEAGPRQAKIIFKTTDGKKEYSTETIIKQEGATGSLALPMTIAQAKQAALAGSTAAVYIKGIVTKFDNNGEFGAKYGNGSFFLSDSGDIESENAFLAYRALWFEGAKWTEGQPQLEAGAEVLLYGSLATNNAAPQVSGSPKIISINGVTSVENGIGTLNAPFKTLGGIEAAKAGIKSKVYVEGTVSKLVSGKNKSGEYIDGFNADYGNGSFWISSDGVYNNDKTKDFEAYQVYWLQNSKWTAENPQIAVGDNVVLYGPLTTYSGTSETQGKGAAYIYSLNGSTGEEVAESE